jgi:thiazole synthase
MTDTDVLKFGDHEFNSRLILGTGKFVDFPTMQAAHEAGGTELVTVAIRRVDLTAPKGENILDFIDREKIKLLPNTAGCFTADDAVVTARLARELLGTDLIKLEVIGDPDTLFPDNEGTLEAARVLVKDGFTVLPYCLDDPITCKRLEEIGCAAVMPLAAPIGSGLGVRNPYNLAIILERAGVPVIVDAGVGCASDAAFAMELGVDGLLINTAVAAAKDPVMMARAMKAGTEAGRLSYLAGRIPRRLYANASSPMTGLIDTRASG